MSEAKAIRESLNYCIEHEIDNIIIETNSLAMVHEIEVDWDVPLNVALEVSIIRRLRRSVSARVKHSLREENALVDFLTNSIFSFAGNFFDQLFSRYSN